MKILSNLALACILALPCLAAAGRPPGATLGPVTGTIALYQFNEGSGATVADQMGAHSGTLPAMNPPVWTSGQDGRALDFTPPDCNLYPNTSVPAGPTWTLQALVRFPLAANASGINTLAGWGQAAGCHVVAVSGELGMLVSGASSFQGSGYSVTSLSGWHLLSAVGNAGKTTFYIDGAQAGSPAAGQVTNPMWMIGGINANRPWGAPIDVIRILNVARSPQDIAADWNILIPDPPSPPQIVGQFDADGDAIAQGGSTHGAFRVDARVSAPAGGDLILEVEVKPVGSSFDGSTGVSQGPVVASGLLTSVEIAGLPVGGYHWQARTIYADAPLAGAWVSQGANPDNLNEVDVSFDNSAPIAPAPALQLSEATGVSISSGQRIDDTNAVRFEAVASDPDLDAVCLQVEVIPFGGSWSGTPTAQGGFVPSGASASVSVLPPLGSYLWRYRVADAGGAFSAWTAYGDGSAPDFEAIPAGSRGSGFCAASAIGSSPSGAALIVSLLLAAAAIRTSHFVIRN